MNHFRPTWPDRSPMGSGSVSARQDWRRNGPRLVFFVLGGMTMAEIREVYKVSEMMERDVYIGKK